MAAYGDNNKGLIEVIQLQNNGQHRQAAAILQREGNKDRPVHEKEALWKAAEHARKIADSD